MSTVSVWFIFRSGLTDESSLKFKLVMQKEILVQAVANMGPLSLPLMLQVRAQYFPRIMK